MLSLIIVIVGFQIISCLTINTKQECSICELDNQFNAQTNYTCYTIGLSELTICTCPDGQYLMNTRCRYCDRPNICGSGEDILCKETPTANPPGYICFCPNNQFTFNQPCSAIPTTTTQRPTTSTSFTEISSDKLGSAIGNIQVTSNSQVAERGHTAQYGNGASVRGTILRTVGIHRIRIQIERMYLNRELFIGIQSISGDSISCPGYNFDNIGFTNCATTRASGWFGNNKIAVFGQHYNSGVSSNQYYNETYEQFYITNDIITLIINCEDATLTLQNDRTGKEYRMSVDHGTYSYGKLPWILYINLFYPGDKIRLLSSENI
ncbi:hypothetical protein I4U23_005784 [Adineta vaga]|nr:hypothetical protein I4U23_005784 [Adineta vaga]